MKLVSSLRHRFPLRFFAATALTLVVALAALFTTGCGAGGAPGTKLTGNTQVTVLLSSTANDQFQLLQVGFTNLALTSQSEKTVSLLSTLPEQGAEFIHINGGAEPLPAVSVPQDVYTAATATNLSYQFVCAAFLAPNSLDVSTFGDSFGGPNATVNFPAPITITGDSMALSLDLLVSPSVTLSSCYNPGGGYTWTFTPTFNLAALTLVSQPTNPENGKITGLHGEIAAIDGNSFTIALPVAEGPQTLLASANTATVYQGISDSSGLGVGTLIDMDGTLQSDGSLLATRIAVYDTAATNVVVGPLLYVVSSASDITMVPNQEFGASFQTQEAFGGFTFNYGSVAFQISQQLTNLQSLPFIPSFTATNMVAGQNVYLTAPAIPSAGPFVDARTVTLIPQTIDGTISATSNSGSFAVLMAVQPEQQTLLTNPNQVDVYVDSNTQMLNSEQLSVGNTLRFSGLIFNDNGTLRMDCAEVNDGVPE